MEYFYTFTWCQLSELATVAFRAKTSCQLSEWTLRLTVALRAAKSRKLSELTLLSTVAFWATQIFSTLRFDITATPSLLSYQSPVNCRSWDSFPLPEVTTVTLKHQKNLKIIYHQFRLYFLVFHSNCLFVCVCGRVISGVIENSLLRNLF